MGGKRVVGSDIQRRKAKKSRRGRVDPIRRSEMLMVQNARGERSDGEELAREEKKELAGSAEEGSGDETRKRQTAAFLERPIEQNSGGDGRMIIRQSF